MAIKFLSAPIESASGRSFSEIHDALVRNNMRRDRLAVLWHQQNGRCFYCDCDIYLEIPATHGMAATRDHIFPKAVRKRVKPSRLRDACVAACLRCNQERGHLRWHEYIAIHEARKAFGKDGGHYESGPRVD